METVPSLSVFNAKEAIAYYQEVLNATLEDIYYMRDNPEYKDSPYKDLVLHSRLKIGDTIFYLSDQQDDHIQEVGKNIQFCLNVFSEEEFLTLYKKFNEKATLKRDITEEYWHAKTFSVQDPYDIIWHIFYIMEVPK